MFELKRIHKESIEAALAKAERYRLLNEASEAESICRDVLEVEPENQRALVTLILALTDKYRRGQGPSVHVCRELLARLDSEYDRSYYAGIICERQAKALLEQGHLGSNRNVHQSLREAMEHFEKAETLAPHGNDDAILRWNTCARLLMQRRDLRPAEEDEFRPLLE